MTYDGGKAGFGAYQTIINQIPPHRVYVEPFLGEGAVLRNKKPALSSIGIDKDATMLAERWRGNEITNLQLVAGDSLLWLLSYPWQGDEFIYADPPYLMHTRSYQRPLYREEFATVEQHLQLLHILKALPCRVAISGYHSDLYAEELTSWRSISFKMMKRNGKQATEVLWMNYPAPLELHDYRYLGRSFRERERIKRKSQRWQDRIARLPHLERQALLAAIDSIKGAQL